MMLKCRDLTRLVASDGVEDFGFMKRMEIKFHLFMCKHCRDYVAQIRSIGKGARDMAAETEPDPEQLQRLEKEICDEICHHDHGSD
jgi:anti-sigma factor ChrR (cupin superfamily)